MITYIDTQAKCTGENFAHEIVAITRTCGMDIVSTQHKLEKLWIRVRNSVVHKAQIGYLNIFLDALRNTPALTSLAIRLEKHANFLIGVHTGQDKNGNFIMDKNPQHAVLFIAGDGQFHFCHENPSAALAQIRKANAYPAFIDFKQGRMRKAITEEEKRKASQRKAGKIAETLKSAYQECAESVDALSAERMLRAAITHYGKLPYDMRSKYGNAILELHIQLVRQQMQDLDKEAEIRPAIEEKTKTVIAL